MGNKNTKQKLDDVAEVSTNISRGGEGEAKIQELAYSDDSGHQGCLVFGCTENHNRHYCRVCKSKDSDHFSRMCRKRKKKKKAKPSLPPLPVLTPVLPVSPLIAIPVVTEVSPVIAEAVLPN